MRANVNAGYADYLPVHLGESQKLYRSGALRCDVAMVQVSLPDGNGMVSLGTSVDCSLAAIESTKHAIGVVNPNVPFAYGDLVSLDAFEFLVQDDTPLVTKDFAEPTPTEVLIGKNCAELVPDGACIQMGIGALPNALAAQLKDHRDLGVHTEMFADGILRLIRSGVVNGANKKIDRAVERLQEIREHKRGGEFQQTDGQIPFDQIAFFVLFGIHKSTLSLRLRRRGHVRAVDCNTLRERVKSCESRARR